MTTAHSHPGMQTNEALLGYNSNKQHSLETAAQDWMKWRQTI